ncbi:hypothetical protein D3C86_975810 [compost metagenome]
MQGLTELQEHVVGHVHHVRDGADPSEFKTLLEPVGRGADLEAFDDQRRVAGAEIGRFERHLDGRSALGGHGSRSGQLQLAETRGGELARHAQHREGVGAVGEDGDLDDGVAHFEGGRSGHAHRGAHGEDIDALGFLGETQLHGRAVHAEALDAAELGSLDFEAVGEVRADHGDGDDVTDLDVLGAGHDLERLGRADVRGADSQAVGIGVLLGGHDLAGDDVLEAGRHALDALDLEAGGGQGLRDRLEIAHGRPSK